MSNHEPPLPRIRCAVCRRDVERVYWRHSDLDRTTTIIVSCHGKMDESTMTAEFLQQFRGDLPHGEAFVDEAREAALLHELRMAPTPPLDEQTLRAIGAEETPGFQDFVDHVQGEMAKALGLPAHLLTNGREW